MSNECCTEFHAMPCLPPEAWHEALRLAAAWGEDAGLEAARQADACLDAGDLEGPAR
jgi:hypothetical protein